MQKEKKTDCPQNIWMSAKICLPDGKRGFAVGKIIEKPDQSLNLVLTLDQSFLGSSSDVGRDINKWNSVLLSSQENLLSLPRGTAILLAPPKIFGVRFWIARVGETMEVTAYGKPEDNTIAYDLIELKRLKNFLEARSAPRVVFRTPILLVDTKTYKLTQFFTRDISQTGLSLAVDIASPDNIDFQVNDCYLLQLKIHEGMTMPPLNYRCIHIREDILTGAKIIGLILEDRKSKDPEVEYNLTLLTWSDSLDELEAEKNDEESF
jgi:hypothetical protein